MAKQKTVVPFKGTAEQEAKLREVIAAHRDMQGALMPVLQKAQDIYGYLPIEVQSIIAEGLELSLEQVYQVVTFYSQFALNPTGKYRIAVCLGTACYVKGAQQVLDELEKELGVKAGGKLELSLSPDMVLPAGATMLVLGRSRDLHKCFHI